jgi:hypothetical protein
VCRSSSVVPSGEATGTLRNVTVTVFLILILAVSALSRIAFLSNTLVGEEGIFAYSVIGLQPSSDGGPWLLIAELEGKPVFGSPAHNAVPYWIIETLGRLVVPSIDLPRTSFFWKSVIARLPFVVFFCVGIVGLFWMLGRLTHKGSAVLAVGGMVVLFGLTNPLAVGASIQPQIDGSIGVMLTGSAAFMLFLACESQSQWQALALSFIAGILASIGKHEWAMAFGGACLITAAAVITFGVLSNSREAFYRMLFILRLLGLFASGLAVGTLISLIACFHCYVSGFNVMRDIYNAWSGSHTAVMKQVRSFFPVIFLGGFGTILMLWNCRRIFMGRPGAPLVLMTAGAIFGGFFLSGWVGDSFPRYYAPALVLSMYAILSMLDAIGRQRLELRAVPVVIVLIALSVGVALNAVALYELRTTGVSITSFYGSSLETYQQRYAESAEKSSKEHKIMLESPAIAIYYPGTEFVADSFGASEALELVRVQASHRVEDLVLP